MRAANVGFVLALVLVSSASSSHAEDSNAPPLDDAVRAAEFVREGDNARAKGQLSKAVIAYKSALDLHDDPVVAGRLGLIALQGGATPEAVGLLLRALLDPEDAKPFERKQFHEAYERARLLVCRVDIKLPRLGAEVFVDGKLEPWGASKSEFYLFVRPGHHEIRARLEGHKDASQSFEAPKGGRYPVTLVFEPEPLPQKPAQASPAIAAETPKPIATETPKPIATETPKPIADFPRAPQAEPQKQAAHAIKQFSPWSLGFGPVVVAGAVSQWPAVGFGGAFQKKLHEVYFARFGFRWAVAPSEIEHWPIQGSTFGVLPSICARPGAFSACLVSQIGAINHSTVAPVSASIWHVTWGLGGGLSLDILTLGGFRIQAGLDAVLLLDTVPVKTGRLGSKTQSILWEGPQALAGLNIELLWNL